MVGMKNEYDFRIYSEVKKVGLDTLIEYGRS